MSITTQMVNLAITSISDVKQMVDSRSMEDFSLSLLEYYDLDDELGLLSINILTRAVKLFGGAVTSKVSGGNSTGVHLLPASSTRGTSRGMPQTPSRALQLCLE